MNKVILDGGFVVDLDTKTLLKYEGENGHVVIPEGIEHINSEAFFSRSGNLKKVIVPESVQELQAYTFSNCVQLETIELPEKIDYIGESCFSQCNKLKNIKLPRVVEYLDKNCFYMCNSLEEIELPEFVLSLGELCFSYCAKLKSIKIPNTTLSIGKGCFIGCKDLRYVDIPSSVTQIGKNAYSWNLDKNGYVEYPFSDCLSYCDIPFIIDSNSTFLGFDSIDKFISILKMQNGYCDKIDFSMVSEEDPEVINCCNMVLKQVIRLLDDSQINSKILHRFNKDSFISNMKILMQSGLTINDVVHEICDNSYNLVSSSINTAVSNYNYLIKQSILDRKTMNMLFFNFDSDIEITEDNIGSILLDYFHDNHKFPDLLNILLVESNDENRLDIRDRLNETQIVNDLKLRGLDERLLKDSRYKMKRSYFENIVLDDKEKLRRQSNVRYDNYTGKYHQLNGIMIPLCAKMDSFNKSWFDQFYEFIDSSREVTEFDQFLQSLTTVQNWNNYSSEKDRASYLKNEIFGRLLYANVYMTLEEKCLNGFDDILVKYLRENGVGESEVSSYLNGERELSDSNDFMNFLLRNGASTEIKSNIKFLRKMPIKTIPDFKENVVKYYTEYMCNTNKKGLEELLMTSSIPVSKLLKFASKGRDELFNNSTIIDFVLEYDPYSFEALRIMPRERLNEEDLEFQTLKRMLSKISPEDIFKGNKRFLVFSTEDKKAYKKIDSTLDFNSVSDYVEYIGNKISIDKIPEEDIDIYLDRFSKMVSSYVSSLDTDELFNVCNALDLYLRNKAVYDLQSIDEFDSASVAKEIFDKDGNHDDNTRMFYSLYNLNRLAHFSRDYDVKARNRSKYRFSIFSGNREKNANTELEITLKNYNKLAELGFDFKRLNFERNESVIETIANSNKMENYTLNDVIAEAGQHPENAVAIAERFKKVSDLKLNLKMLLNDDVRDDDEHLGKLISADETFELFKYINNLDEKIKRDMFILALEEETFFQCKKTFADELQKRFVQEILQNSFGVGDSFLDNILPFINATKEQKREFFDKNGYVVEFQKDTKGDSAEGNLTLVCYCDKFEEAFSVHLIDTDISQEVVNQIDPNNYTLAHCRLGTGLHLKNENNSYDEIDSTITPGFLEPQNFGVKKSELIKKIVNYNAMNYPSIKKKSSTVGNNRELNDMFKELNGSSNVNMTINPIGK